MPSDTDILTSSALPPPARWRRFASGSLWLLLAFVGAAVLILAMTWPWCLHWRGEFLDHWDPPFHAWKLEFMARRILAGDIFCSSGGTGNTNMLYPQSGALYFEALQWPPALFAAPLFALTSLPSETIYHITLLVFWALSAPCMFLLLRELSCSRLAALVGALVFCILPHRMTYCIEFQMELIFAMPLVYLFLLRFFRRLRPLDAVALAASWWLLAVSELYEAVFVLLSLPLLVIAFLAARPRLLADRRLWIGGIAAGVTGAALLPAMLLPYLTQQAEGSVVRSMKEVARHAAQPFSYLLPWGRFRPWGLDAHLDEFSLYPTLAVLVLALAAAAIWLRRDWAAAYSPRPLNPPPENRLFRLFRPILRFFPPVSHALPPLCALLFALLFAFPLFGWRPWAHPFSDVIFFFFQAALYTLPFLLLIPRPGESSRTTFLRAFAAVACVACVLSFGPYVTAGNPRHDHLAKFRNLFYITCHEDWLPLLANFRVASRFGVLVLFFLVCTASVAADSFSRRARRPFLRALLPLLLLAFCILESIPPRSWVETFRRIDPIRNAPAVRSLLAVHPPCTLAAIPVQERMIEGMRMFSLLKDDFPYTYVWGGYFPAFATKTVDAWALNLRSLWYRNLASLYPPVIVLADRASPSMIHEDHKPFAPGEAAFVNPNNWAAPPDPDGPSELLVDLDHWLDPVAFPIARDSRFSLHVLRPLPPASHAVKRFRSDVARLNPRLDVLLAFSDPASALPVSLLINGSSCGTFIPLPDGTVPIQLDLSAFPASLWSKSLPNQLELLAGDASPDAPAFQLLRFSLLAPDGLYHDPCTGRSLAPTTFPTPDSPWL